MKKQLLTLACLVLTAVMLLVPVCANEIADVPENSWFSVGVETSTEAGLMSASEGLFKPHESFDAGQALVSLARLHALANGMSSSVSNAAQARTYLYDIGFDERVLALQDNAPMTRGMFALGLYTAVGKLETLNEVDTAPDVKGTQYEDAVREMYKAGVLTGFDASGTFLPDMNLTRAQGAVAFQRVINIFERKNVDYSSFDEREAMYLIDDFMTMVAPRSQPITGSGWIYDWAGDVSEINADGRYTNVLSDYSVTSHVAMYREFFPQSSGKLVLETNFKISNGLNGVRIYFSDTEGNIISELVGKNKYYYLVGSNQYNTYRKIELDKIFHTKLEVDLDAGTTKAYINGEYLGVVNNVKTPNAVDTLTFATTDEDAIVVQPSQVHLYKNYSVNEKFRTFPKNQDLSGPEFDGYGHTVTGTVYTREIFSNKSDTGDTYSAELSNNSSISYSFDAISGIVCAQAHVLMPTQTSGLSLSLYSGDKNVIGVYADNGMFKCGTADLREFSANIWQLVRIEANLDKGVATIKINGKKVAENIAVYADAIDKITIDYSNTEASTVMADDIFVYNLYEYADYVPEPVPLDVGDYILSMSVCNLWRNGSHYGWDAISPYDELTPWLGYYDEGNVEEMDWELKYLIEHGFSTYHMCWYAPSSPADVPIKKPRMVDAFHDGYFNAKYSDMIDFSIMFENAGQNNTTIQQFKDNIWSYWKEWYFSDPRYFTIENKPYLTIYRLDAFLAMSKKSTEAERIAEIKELIAWMREDIKTIGNDGDKKFDGIIITFSDLGRNTANNAKYASLGVDGLIGYAIGTTGYNLEVNKDIISSGFESARAAGVDALSLAGKGFNILAWNQKRTPLMTPTDFNTLLTWFRDEHLPRFGEGWKSKFIQFDTWNEFGEGHYLMPTNTHGFGYLEQVGKVFAKNPEEYDTSKNIVPTDVQKDRLNRLYPANYTQIRRQQLEFGEIVIPNQRVWALDFTDTSNYKLSGGSYIPSKFTSAGLTGVKYSTSEQCLVCKSTNTDPMIYLMPNSTSRNTLFEAKDADMLHIRMWTDKIVNGTIYFATDSHSTLSESMAFQFSAPAKNEFFDLYIDTTENVYWNGSITALRFDPCGAQDVNLKAVVVEALKYGDDQKSMDIVVDGVTASTRYDETTDVTNKEVYATIDSNSGLMTLLKLTTVWNPWDGTLKLKSKNGTVFEFTMGSDIVYVNGNAKKLDKAVYTFDGAPTIPLVFIIENAGYDYNYDFTGKTLEVRVLSKSHSKMDIVNGNADGEGGDFYANDGFVLAPVADKDDSSNKVWSITGNNAQNWAYIRHDFDFNKGETYIVNFDVRIDGPHNGTASTKKHTVYFNPRYADSALASGYDHHEAVAVMDETDGWVHVKHEFTITDTYLDTYADEQLSIFVSPVAIGSGYTTIDYSIDNFTLHRKTAPFKVVNGDAEGPETQAFFTEANTLEIMTDPHNSENKVWGVKTTATTGGHWAYIRTKTEFETGVTYEVEFDVCVTTFKDGTDANNVSICVNPRYVDAMRPAGTENRYDHNGDVKDGRVTISRADGWKHVKCTFTIKNSRLPVNTELKNEEFTIFANPKTENGSYVSVNFMVDNVVVRTI